MGGNGGGVSSTVIGGPFVGPNGQTITGGAAGSWAIAANGTDQDISLTPSGSGGDFVVSFPDSASTQSTRIGLSADSIQMRIGDQTAGPLYGGQGELHLFREGANTTQRLFVVDGGTPKQNYIAGERISGSFASPTPTEAGNILTIVGLGLDHTGLTGSLNHSPEIILAAESLWSGTNHASSVSIKTVATGTTAQITGLKVFGTAVQIGEPNAAAFTPGNLNVYASTNQNLRIRGTGNIAIEAVNDAGSFATLDLEGSSVRFNPILGGGVTMGKAGTAVTFTGFIVESIQALSGPGAANVTEQVTAITTTGALDAITLANGTNGQTKTIFHDVDGGSFVLTPTTATGWSTFTSTAAGESITLVYRTTRGWIVTGSFGGVIA